MSSRLARDVLGRLVVVDVTPGDRPAVLLAATGAMRRRRGEFKRPVLAVAETEHGIIVRLEEALCHSAGEEPRRVIVTAVPDVTDAEIVETLRALADQIGAA